MKKNIISALILISLFCSCKETNQVVDYVKKVDPFIGTGGHGHTFPGSSAPFGMIQVSPDNGISGWDWCSGYHYSDSTIIGFSHLHLSGTGIGDLLDVLMMPTNKTIDLTQLGSNRDSLAYKSTFQHANEQAYAGYYQVYLDQSKINVELTSDKRIAYHKYRFAKNDPQSVVVDLGFRSNWDRTMGSQLELEDEYTLSGYRFSKGWANNQKVFFVAKFSKPIEHIAISKDGTWVDAKTSEGLDLRSQLFFDDQQSDILEVKVAVSSVSIDNAKLNLESPTKNFDQAHSKAVKNWNQNLSKIKVESSRDSLETIFYSALYHSQLAPVLFSDVNGQFRYENDRINSMTNENTYSTLSLWDTFRAENPLLTLIQPKMVPDLVSSMLKYYELKKRLPIWTLYANETHTMTGYHSIPVIVDAYLKGLRNFDADKAYEAMKTTMMSDDRGLDSYKTYGYVPFDHKDESVTMTLEYAFDDWCVAQMAKALNKDEDYHYFMERSKAYAHLFDPQSKFMRGKSSDGQTWNTPFDPKYSNHRVNTDYTEGNAWQHSWFAPHDVEGLIELHGGNELFSKKLTELFTETSEINGDHISNDISGLIGQYAHGNEPSHHIAYMFNIAQKPWLTQYWVRKILDTQYNTTPNGLSGNEDCGQMSAWYVLSSIGIYPMNPVGGVFQIGSPVFDQSSIELEGGKEFVIEAVNNSSTNIYIQAARLNGKPYNQTSITYEQIVKGGTLTLEMGAQPNTNWGINN